jgi:hypothetical protein
MANLPGMLVGRRGARRAAGMNFAGAVASCDARVRGPSPSPTGFTNNRVLRSTAPLAATTVVSRSSIELRWSPSLLPSPGCTELPELDTRAVKQVPNSSGVELGHPGAGRAPRSRRDRPWITPREDEEGGTHVGYRLPISTGIIGRHGHLDTFHGTPPSRNQSLGRSPDPTSSSTTAHGFSPVLRHPASIIIYYYLHKYDHTRTRRVLALVWQSAPRRSLPIPRLRN